MTTLRVVKVSVAEKKFNPDQPRVPAGDPRGGQWAAEGGGAKAVFKNDEASLLWKDCVGIGAQAKTANDFLSFFAVDGYSAEMTVGQVAKNEDLTKTMLIVRYSHLDGTRGGILEIRLDKDNLGFVKAGEDASGSYIYSDFDEPNLEDVLERRITKSSVRDALGWHGVFVDLAPADGSFYSQQERTLFDAGTLPESEWERMWYDGVNALKQDTGSPDAWRFQAYWGAWAGEERDHLQSVAWDRAQRTASMSTNDDITNAAALLEKDRETNSKAQKAYDSVYRRTQEFFKSQGLKPEDEVVLYRGMILSKAEHPNLSNAVRGEKVAVKPRPLSSFSANAYSASQFALHRKHGEVGLVFGVRVPVKAIFSHWTTGFGAFAVNEAVVHGSWLADHPWEVIRRYE